MVTRISQCPRRYYWGYSTNGHTDILPRQILLRVHNWWSCRYHTAQADIIEGTERMVTQISHFPGRYYWVYRTDGHTDITLPRQGTELIAIQISHCPRRYYWGYRTDRHTDITLLSQISSFYFIKIFICSSHRICVKVRYLLFWIYLG